MIAESLETKLDVDRRRSQPKAPRVEMPQRAPAENLEVDFDDEDLYANVPCTD